MAPGASTPGSSQRSSVAPTRLTAVVKLVPSGPLEVPATYSSRGNRLSTIETDRNRRVTHVAINDRVGQRVARLGLGRADSFDDGKAGAIGGRFDAGHRVRTPHLDRFAGSLD